MLNNKFMVFIFLFKEEKKLVKAILIFKNYVILFNKNLDIKTHLT